MMLASPTFNVGLTISRLICALILHLSLQAELTQGLNLMKFALNHSHLFQSYKMAYFSGLCQALMVIGVETINILAIM